MVEHIGGSGFTAISPNEFAPRSVSVINLTSSMKNNNSSSAHQNQRAIDFHPE
jgi:hypothetical protein